MYNETTYTITDDSWTNGYGDNWTRNDIMSSAKAFGVEVEIDDLTGNVYEVNGDDRKLIGTRD